MTGWLVVAGPRDSPIEPRTIAMICEDNDPLLALKDELAKAGL